MIMPERLDPEEEDPTREAVLNLETLLVEEIIAMGYSPEEAPKVAQEFLQPAKKKLL